jgi:ribosomal protein S18 acetylase RimI-like enzyme
MQDGDPFGSYGLHPVELGDKALFDEHFGACRTTLSDYTFANTFIWREPIHLRWTVLNECLCVFANGDGGLTMLFPPLGAGDIRLAMDRCVQICGDYNSRAGLPDWTRIEYVAQDMLPLMGPGYAVAPMSGDYVYPTARMIDLAGGDLASKRQARNRFARRYQARTETYSPHHLGPCLELLDLWRSQNNLAEGAGNVTLRRAKELIATVEVLRHSRELGLVGMVLYAGEQLAGFTFGERLGGRDCCSILIEKTNRELAGSANFIFSEFCRLHWAHTTWCNVGDDWDVPSLAWTKQSYRPAMRLPKYVLRPLAKVSQVSPVAGGPDVQAAGHGDLEAMVELENRCFAKGVAMKRRQLRYMLRSPNASVRVVRQDGRIVAQALVLRRRTPRGTVGRVYSIAVDQDCRGRGLGRTLLCDCLRQLRQEGVRRVVLEVDVQNTPAVSLYESEGFCRLRRLRDYYAPGRDAWKMRLDVQAPA